MIIINQLSNLCYACTMKRLYSNRIKGNYSHIARLEHTIMRNNAKTECNIMSIHSDVFAHKTKKKIFLQSMK